VHPHGLPEQKTAMRRLSEGVIRYRWALLLFLAAVTAGLGYEIRRTASSYEYESWLPAGDEVAERVKEVDREFSATMVMFVVLDFGDRGVFHPDSLRRMERITGELEAMDGLSDVTGLLNVVDIRKIQDGVRVGKLVREIPGTDAEMASFREYVLAQERYVGTLVSANGRFGALVIHLDSAGDELKVAEQVIGRVEALAGHVPCTFGGDPAVALALSEYSNQDLRRLVPVMLAVMVLVLGFGLRRFLGVVLPLGIVVICIVWTFGLKAVLGYPFNMLSPSVAVMLIAIGSDYAVHIYNHFLKRREIVPAMTEIAPPVIMSALTTILGLLTFAVTGIPNLTAFGIELAMGLASACLLSLVLLPICLHVFRARPGPAAAGAAAGRHVFSRALSAVGDGVYRHAGGVLLLTGACVALAALGIPRISTNVDFVELLPEDSLPRRGNEILEKHFGGMYANTLCFKGDLGDPAVLDRQLYVESFLGSQDMLSSFHSLNGYIAEENWLLSGVYAVPETREGVSGLWLLLEAEEMLEMVVSPERDHGLVTSFIRGSSTGEIKEVSRRIAAFFHETLSDTVVVVDPGRLSPAAAAALRELRVRDAARQLTWLCARYGGDAAPCDPQRLAARLGEALPAAEREPPARAALQDGERYLREETVEALPEHVVDGWMRRVRERAGSLDDPGVRAALEAQAVAAGVLGPEDARFTVEGLAARVGSALRMQRSRQLWESVRDLLPGGLERNAHVEKRAQGVLWSLLGDRPAFFSKQLAALPGVGPGVVSTREVVVRQSGFPEIIIRLEAVLARSQYVSLFLASLAVFGLVSLTQLSLRRGLASLLSVLVPMALVMGMMGWFGIPLDFGTVLSGALVVGLGIDGSIHLLHYYHQLRAARTERREALRAALGHVGRAVATANGTTCFGFLILLFAHTSAVRNFAFTCGVAIVLVTVSVLTFLPALVVVLGVASERQGQRTRP